METVLVVDDDRHIADLMALHLEREGYRTLTAEDGDHALDLVVKESPALVVLDVMLPGQSGIDVCRCIRGRDGPQPVIVLLSARVHETDAVTGLDAGADEYVRKPFGIRELVSRVRALLRMARRDPAPPQPAAEALQRGALSIDRRRHLVSYQGRPITLTATEFNLLHHLATNPGLVLSREHLLRSVWGYQHEGYQRTVDSHITRVRKKLEGAGAPTAMIWTVHGVGYRFQPPA